MSIYLHAYMSPSINKTNDDHSDPNNPSSTTHQHTHTHLSSSSSLGKKTRSVAPRIVSISTTCDTRRRSFSCRGLRFVDSSCDWLGWPGGQVEGKGKGKGGWMDGRTDG